MRPFDFTIPVGLLHPSCDLNVRRHPEPANKELSVLQLPHLRITSSWDLLPEPLLYLLECGGAPGDISNETSHEDVPNCLILALFLSAYFLSPQNLRSCQFRGVILWNVLPPCALGTGPLSVSYPSAYVSYQRVVAFLGLMASCETSVTPFIHFCLSH